MARPRADRVQFDRNRAGLRRALDEVWETTARAHPQQEVSVTLPGLTKRTPGVWNFFEGDARAIDYVKHADYHETPHGPGWTVTFHPYSVVQRMRDGT